MLTPIQRKRAVKWFAQALEDTEAPLKEQIEAREKLADEGDDDSLAWLGDLYREGRGDIDPDPIRAKDFYERGANLGSVDALRELGKIFEAEGDNEGAKKSYEQAAELGGDGYSRDRLAEKFGLSWYARTEEEKAEDDAD